MYNLHVFWICVFLPTCTKLIPFATCDIKFGHKSICFFTTTCFHIHTTAKRGFAGKGEPKIKCWQQNLKVDSQL